MADSMIRFEVVYATAEEQALLSLEAAPGTTVRAAVLASDLAQRFAGLDLAQCPLGIFGKVVAHPETQVVEEGDRIEIYRPLLADPKEVRRLRAERAAKAKKQAGSI
ncbi:RnfH family protein [Pseudomonas sp. NPDC090202]|uniref:RnfH family protein n=1 Tax=unclassified Pseudomonas TaxID=196821 RepID=UPI0037F8FB06